MLISLHVPSSVSGQLNTHLMETFCFIYGGIFFSPFLFQSKIRIIRLSRDFKHSNTHALSQHTNLTLI